MNRNGSNAHAVVVGETEDFMPTWSPDGTKLVFSRVAESDEPYNDDIYVADADGANIVVVIADPDDTFGPDWQPLH
jgi:Tol biopolymer transport system component